MVGDAADEEGAVCVDAPVGPVAGVAAQPD
ncbi:MAG: hypothetical protein JWP05_2669, partial [Microbacteriaceae bacterium]|nr:hypothetical protein [Microbacteriaceae bacterium]